MTNQQSIPDESESYVCSDCGVDVSIDDEVCPKCGADLSEIEEDKEEVESTHANEYSAASDFFSFRKMISPTLVKIIYVLGIAAITIVGLVSISQAGRYHEERIWMGLGVIVLGNIIWRIICEGWILLFSIHDILGSIEKLQRDKT